MRLTISVSRDSTFAPAASTCQAYSRHRSRSVRDSRKTERCAHPVADQRLHGAFSKSAPGPGFPRLFKVGQIVPWQLELPVYCNFSLKPDASFGDREMFSRPDALF